MTTGRANRLVRATRARQAYVLRTEKDGPAVHRGASYLDWFRWWEWRKARLKIFDDEILRLKQAHLNYTRSKACHKRKERRSRSRKRKT